MKLLEVKNIRIGDKDYPSKMSVRAMITFEELSGHSISQMKTLSDSTILFYCTIKAGGSDLSYEQFMDLIDDKPEALKDFADKWVEPTEKKQKAR